LRVCAAVTFARIHLIPSCRSSWRSIQNWISR
jgi:hypothetical protein